MYSDYSNLISEAEKISTQSGSSAGNISGILKLIEGLGIGLLFVGLAVFLLFWANAKIMRKFGKPWWYCFLPSFCHRFCIYDYVDGNGWYALLTVLFPIPFLIVFLLKLGKTFGKSAGWSVFWLMLLPVFGLMILGFGDAEPEVPDKSSGVMGPVRRMITEAVSEAKGNARNPGQADAAAQAPKTPSGKICPQCGLPNDTDAVFCERCGGPLK